MHAPPQQLPPPSQAGPEAVAAAPTLPVTDITSIVSWLLHVGQAGALRRSAVFRIRSNLPPQSRHAYS